MAALIHAENDFNSDAFCPESPWKQELDSLFTLANSVCHHDQQMDWCSAEDDGINILVATSQQL